jgi:hypothetical protein
MLRLTGEGKSATTDDDCTRKSDESEVFVQRPYDRRLALEGEDGQSQEEGMALWNVPVRIGSMRRRTSGRKGVLENMCVADVEAWLCETRACF